jgi:hypothetical protein
MAAPCNANIAHQNSIGLRYPPRSLQHPKNNDNKEDNNSFIIPFAMTVNITFRAENQRSGATQHVDNGEFASASVPPMPMLRNHTHAHLNV